MSPIKRLFVVVNPTQYLNAVEYSVTTAGNEDHLVIMSFHRERIEELNMLGADQVWASIRFLDFSKKSINGDRRFWQLSRSYIADAFETVKPSELVVGNLVDGIIYPFVLQVKSKLSRISLLDDGTPTLNIAEHRFHKSFARTYHFDSLKSSLKRFLFLGQVFQLQSPPRHLRFFTLFNFPVRSEDELVANHYPWTRSLVSAHKAGSGAWFIGSHLVDRHLISERAYLDSVRFIKDFAESQGEEFTYIHHRSESQNVKDKLKQICSTTEFSRPLELAFLDEPCPRLLLGHFSSALFTMSRIYPESQVKAFLFPEGEIKGNIFEPRDYVLRVQEALRRDEYVETIDLPLHYDFLVQ